MLNKLRERIVLLNVVVGVDDELNRIEKLTPIKEVWASVEVKNTAYVGTDTGERPETRYKVTIRRTDAAFLYVYWKNKVYRLTAPSYDVDYKYTCFEMVGTNGEELITTNFFKECR